MKLARVIFQKMALLAGVMIVVLCLRLRRSGREVIARLPIPPFKLLVINQTWPDKPLFNHCREDGRRKIGYLKTYKTAST